MVSALQYISKKNIIHRDLKPGRGVVYDLLENIMIMYDDKGEIRIKLIDFGLAAQLENQNHSLFLKNCGTLLFMAPELVQKKAYNWVRGV